MNLDVHVTRQILFAFLWDKFLLRGHYCAITPVTLPFASKISVRVNPREALLKMKDRCVMLLVPGFDAQARNISFIFLSHMHHYVPLHCDKKAQCNYLPRIYGVAFIRCISHRTNVARPIPRFPPPTQVAPRRHVDSGDITSSTKFEHFN